MLEAQASSLVRARHLRRAAQATGLACLCWLAGLTLVLYDLWHLPYPLDLPSSLSVAIMLTLSSWGFWHFFSRQALRDEQASRKKWLMLLLVQRQEVETALNELTAAHTKVSEVISESDQPRLQQIWTDVVMHAKRTHADQLTTPLASAMSTQSSLTTGLQTLTEDLRNLQIQFNQGAHQNQLIYQMHEALTTLHMLIGQSNTAWENLSRAYSDRQNHLLSQDTTPEQQFETWRQHLRALQKRLRLIEQSLRTGLGEVVAEPHSSPDLLKRIDPRGPA